MRAPSLPGPRYPMTFVLTAEASPVLGSGAASATPPLTPSEPNDGLPFCPSRARKSKPSQQRDASVGGELALKQWFDTVGSTRGRRDVAWPLGTAGPCDTIIALVSMGPSSFASAGHRCGGALWAPRQPVR